MMSVLTRLIVFSVAAWLVEIAPEALAKDPPQLPCGVEPNPPFAADEMRPNIQIWQNADLPANWQPPACAGLNATGPRLAIALAAAFQSSSSVDNLAARFGAISETKGIKYWSVSDKSWQILITDAAALTAVDGTRRPDFTGAEVLSGADLYFEQQDNRSSDFVVYRLRVGTATHDRLSITIENVSDVRVFGISVFRPGDLQSTYILQRQQQRSWTFYSLGIVRKGRSWGDAPASSYVNRAMAFYRDFVGLPTDQEPPAAP